MFRDFYKILLKTTSLLYILGSLKKKEKEKPKKLFIYFWVVEKI